jgi:hypothetical protein
MADTYQVTRSTTIAAPAADVFDRISKFSRWQEWSPWEDLDPDMTKTFSGNDGEVGSGYRWSGNRKAGAGSMAMTSISAPSRIEADLEFLKPFKSQNTLSFDLAESDGSTIVTWTMDATHNLMTRVMNVFGLMDRMIGKDFEKGLASLKAQAEA